MCRLHGSYEALKYGSLVDGLADLTGGITEMLPMPDLPDAVSLKSLLETTSIVTAYYYPAVSFKTVRFSDIFSITKLYRNRLIFPGK